VQNLHAFHTATAQCFIIWYVFSRHIPIIPSTATHSPIISANTRAAFIGGSCPSHSCTSASPSSSRTTQFIAAQHFLASNPDATFVPTPEAGITHSGSVSACTSLLTSRPSPQNIEIVKLSRCTPCTACAPCSPTTNTNADIELSSYSHSDSISVISAHSTDNSAHTPRYTLAPCRDMQV